MKLAAVEKARSLVMKYNRHNLNYFERKLINALITVIDAVDLLEDKEENKHVISTCPSCEHYEKWEPIDMCNSPHNQSFGCVYWREKK